jgi:hypothetical protein
MNRVENVKNAIPFEKRRERKGKGRIAEQMHMGERKLVVR